MYKNMLIIVIPMIYFVIFSLLSLFYYKCLIEKRVNIDIVTKDIRYNEFYKWNIIASSTTLFLIGVAYFFLKKGEMALWLAIFCLLILTTTTLLGSFFAKREENGILVYRILKKVVLIKYLFIVGIWIFVIYPLLYLGVYFLTNNNI